MNEKQKKLDSLLQKFRTGSATDKELFELFSLCNSSTFEDDMDNILLYGLEHTPAPQISKKEIESRYNEVCENLNIKTHKPLRKSLVKWSRYAAAVLIPLLLGWYLADNITFTNNMRNSQELSFFVEKGGKGSTLLADGSKVWLNSNSKLTYSNLRENEVQLSGEGYFEIEHQSDRKFKVITDYFDIIVYGTSFNVSTYDEDRIVQVNLLEGSISISQSDKELFKVSPGQSVEYVKNENKFEIKQKDLTDISIWKDSQLIISDMDERRLHHKLEAWYGVTIRTLNKEKQKRLYNLVITTESIENALELISKLSPLEYKVEGKEVTIIYK